MQGYRALLLRLKLVLARSTPVPDKDEDVRTLVHAWLREAAVANTWVCVLDDLPDPTDLGGLKWLVSGAEEFPWGYGKTMVTSRFRAWIDQLGAAHSWELGCLAADEAHEILSCRAEHWREDAAGVAAVARRLSYFPLALVSAAACAKSYRLSAHEYLEELAKRSSEFLQGWDSRAKREGEYLFRTQRWSR